MKVLWSSWQALSQGDVAPANLAPVEEKSWSPVPGAVGGQAAAVPPPGMLPLEKASPCVLHCEDGAEKRLWPRSRKCPQIPVNQHFPSVRGAARKIHGLFAHRSRAVGEKGSEKQLKLPDCFP